MVTSFPTITDGESWSSGPGDAATFLNSVTAAFNAAEADIAAILAAYVATVPAPTGVIATDTATIAAALAASHASGMEQVLRAGTYVVHGGTLTPDSLASLCGQGQDLTTIQLGPSENADMFVTANFTTLTGTASNAGVYGVSLRRMTLDGNKANNTSGRAFVHYGYRPRLADMRITGFASTTPAVYSEWGLTSAVSSDTLNGGTMEGRSTALFIDRNNGGAIDWEGPSDSLFDRIIAAKNGASTNSQVAITAAGNATGALFQQCHVWGAQHSFGYKLTATSCQLNDCEGEGAGTAQVWFDGGGQSISGGRYFDGGVTGSQFLQVGTVAGSNPGDHKVDTKVTNLGINFAHDGGNSSYKLKGYWADSSKTLISGTQHASNPNKFDVKLDGGAKVGQTSTIAKVLASTSQVAATQHWSPAAAICESILRVGAGTDLSGPLNSSGKMFAVGGLTVPAEKTVSNISWITGAQALVGTPTNQWFALFDAVTGTLLGITADQTSAAWTADTERKLALTTPWTPTVDNAVYAVYMIAGTSLTYPSMRGQFITATIGAILPVLSAIPTNTGLTNPASCPGTLSFASATFSSKMPYVYLS